MRLVVYVSSKPDTRSTWSFRKMICVCQDPKQQELMGGIPFFFENPQKLRKNASNYFKRLCGPRELLSYPGSLASCSYAPFITCFQWPPPSRLWLAGQVGCRVVHSVGGIRNESSTETRALRPGPPFTPSRGGELQQRPRSSSPARREVTGKEPWEPAASSVLIAV